MTRAAVVAAVFVPALSACTTTVPMAAREAGPAFDPIAFFTGVTHGDATLDKVMGSSQRVTVDSRGTLRPDGTLVLDQHIAATGDTPRDRRWILRPAGTGRWTGSLTDAVGPVETVAQGRAIHIRYTMKKGLSVDQWLAPIAGRRALDNNLYVSKMGLQLAHLHEVIVRR